MRRIVLGLATIVTATVFAGCTLRVGTVDPSHPDYHRPGVAVGEFVIRETEYHGPRYAIMTCTNERTLRRQLDRVLPVRAMTRQSAREMRNTQISHLTGWGCNERVVRGYPSFERAGNYQSPSGQRFTIYRVWQRDGRIRRAFNMGLTAR